MKNWNFTNGWSLKIARVNRAILASMLMVSLIQQTWASEEPAPSIEFLEFLGSGVTVDDEFLDPVNYSEIDDESVSGGSVSEGATKTGNEKTDDDDE